MSPRFKPYSLINCLISVKFLYLRYEVFFLDDIMMSEKTLSKERLVLECLSNGIALKKREIIYKLRNIFSSEKELDTVLKGLKKAGKVSLIRGYNLYCIKENEEYVKSLTRLSKTYKLSMSKIMVLFKEFPKFQIPISIERFRDMVREAYNALIKEGMVEWSIRDSDLFFWLHEKYNLNMNRDTFRKMLTDIRYVLKDFSIEIGEERGGVYVVKIR